MAEIHTTNGYLAIVDDADADLIELGWTGLVTKSGIYIHRRVSEKYAHILVSSYLHRNILSRKLDRILKRHEQVDHINLDTLDNRRSNLRLATPMQNTHNRGKRSNNTSGYKGVTYSKRKHRWLAQIVTGGKHRFLGYFHTPEEAHQAYCEAAEKYHGEFARFE